ncbi:MAG: hypothetical protein ACYTGQ_11325, partial [Planctomycetota bacterium]
MNAPAAKLPGASPSLPQAIVKAASSLSFTVFLFALSMLLVFFGTLAQKHYGINTIVNEVFRGFVAWIDLKIFFPESYDVPGRFPFPGGWLIGVGLVINILSAHISTFKIRTTGARRNWGLIFTVLGFVVMGMVIVGFFAPQVAETKDAAFWRVLFRLSHGATVAVLLYVACQLLFQRRAGIVLLHGGIILLLISEIVTGLWQVESFMRIAEGQTVNYVSHHGVHELAVIDRSDPQQDRVTTVPHSQLRGATPHRVSDAELPFDIEILDYMKNTQVGGLAMLAGARNPATAGDGLRFAAKEAPEVVGVEADKKPDAPAAYARLLDKKTGDELGVYLLSVHFDAQKWPQRVRVGDRDYDLYLRNKRTYKPYAIKLIDFRHDRYVGTNTPKNFSSEIQLTDPTQDIDRTVKIWMNN